ncbi:PQQ-binding-like beta-propeller repeat protein [Streptomyces sp. NPDC093149]|uniref:protein kinase domain-containing protein n=1 Tax=Streptomyces sp. NPDC093149 TaxID=3366031 RepID=UPI00382DBD81
MLKPLLHDDPHRIGSYRLAARLGSGGMGTVYLARSPGGRTVALKTVHAHIAADATFRTRFHLEVDAARVIGGLHGARVFDADPLAETPWLATEYVLGPPLDEAVSRCGPLPEAAVRAVGAALCGALGQLHSSEVVHRDLKPSNVMLSAYGPKVIDFGIARAIGDDRLTRVGAAAGTPAFMSPEQATDQEHTSAGDVFALAGVLAFAATGHGPFGGGQAADLLYRVRYADPDLTGVPTALAPLLARCLTKDPSLRPTTQELAAALHDGHGQFADHLPHAFLAEIARRAAEVWQFRPERLPAAPKEPATGQGVTASPRTGTSRRRLLFLSGAAGLALTGAGLWLRAGGSGEKPETAAGGAATPSGAATRPAARSSARAVEGPWRVLWTNDSSTADSVIPPACTDQVITLRDQSRLRGLDPADGRDLWAYGPMWFDSEVITDGIRLYWIVGESKEERSVVTLDPATGRPARSLAPLTDFDVPAETGGAHLLHASAGTLYLAASDEASDVYHWKLQAMDTTSGKVRWRAPLKRARAGRHYSKAYAKAVGHRLIVGQMLDDLVLSAYDTRSGTLLWRRTLPTRSGSSPSPVNTGDQLATDDTHLYIGAASLQAINLSDGTVAWEFGRNHGAPSDGGDGYGPPAAQGGLVYVAEGDRAIVAVDAERGALFWEAPAPPNIGPATDSPPVLGRTHLYYEAGIGLGAVDLSTQKYAQTMDTKIRNFVYMADKNRLVGVGLNTVEALRLD